MANTSGDRVANLLGAIAVGVSDRIRFAAVEAMPSGGETAAAVVVIGHEPGLSIDQLSRVLRLSHPGTVRLVDRLVKLSLVERQPTALDRRVVALVLTEAGDGQRDRLLAARHVALGILLGLISEEDRRALEDILEKLVAALPDGAVSALAVCRLCDNRRCIQCPMEVFGPVNCARSVA